MFAGKHFETNLRVFSHLFSHPRVEKRDKLFAGKHFVQFAHGGCENKCENSLRIAPNFCENVIKCLPANNFDKMCKQCVNS